MHKKCTKMRPLFSICILFLTQTHTHTIVVVVVVVVIITIVFASAFWSLVPVPAIAPAIPTAIAQPFELLKVFIVVVLGIQCIFVLICVLCYVVVWHAFIGNTQQQHSQHVYLVSICHECAMLCYAILCYAIQPTRLFGEHLS